VACVSEIGDTVSEAVEHAHESRLNSIVAACVAITATFMALCNIKDGNIVQAMEQAQTKAVDQWSYYQAKSVKQSLADSVLDQLNLQRDLTPAMPADARAELDQKVAAYKAKVQRYDDEKAGVEARAKELEAAYDTLNVQDDQFDMAEACMSISIALFGVTALTRKRWLFSFAASLAVFGGALGLAGFLGWNLHPDFLAKIFG
jgi:Domain of unknown function (DUF4337)